MDEFALIVRYGAFGLFCLLCLVAAAFDLWKMIIPNTISILLVALFFANGLFLTFYSGYEVAWLSHIGALAAVLFVGLVAYRFGALGAGDVKLLSAISLWAGFEQNLLDPLITGYYLFDYLILVALCGGALSLGLIILRRLVVGVLLVQSSPQNVTLPRFLLPKEQLPYGVAIALPAFYLAIKLPLLGGFLFL
jgi:Flp pilus assembly protein protease CpaA